MKAPKCIFSILFSIAIAFNSNAQTYHELYRPQIHFSPKAHWMNDPNGMVYFNNTWHLFFQYYPGATVWGPMHWGHAVSSDMIHWKELPVALYPDNLGYIFSGSAVVDSNNTSGFGRDGKMPLVAIFTHHDPKGEKERKINYQNQSLAYSLDNGTTWTKFSGNPVLKNPGIRDFRDPKVFWYARQKKWLMTLATSDRITFFSSPNLKTWKRESEFGAGIGANGGVWECPDLFPLKLGNKTYWVLIVNLNPGGPNGGSATQYFVGNFDGNKFTATFNNIKWLDYGPDEYAGVTWGNTGPRKIFLGWMSNWAYANQVPTKTWRNAMTVPRELGLRQEDGDIFVTSKPAKELMQAAAKPVAIKAGKITDIGRAMGILPKQYLLTWGVSDLNNYKIILSNRFNDKLIIGYERSSNRYFIDRKLAGESSFNKNFIKTSYAPRMVKTVVSDMQLVMDATSAEVFFDNGLTTMTAICFPKEPYNRIEVEGNGCTIKNITLTPLKSIWGNR